MTNKPTDTEILEFLLNRFHVNSPKMNGEHSWVFVNDYYMKGTTAKDAVINAMRATK